MMLEIVIILCQDSLISCLQTKNSGERKSSEESVISQPVKAVYLCTLLPCD